jgi:hypothetical protein
MSDFDKLFLVIFNLIMAWQPWQSQLFLFRSNI